MYRPIKSFSSALASPDFQGREGEGLGQYLAYRLSDVYSNSKCIDLQSLCIVPGQQCWVLYIDALVNCRNCYKVFMVKSLLFKAFSTKTHSVTCNNNYNYNYMFKGPRMEWWCVRLSVIISQICLEQYKV